MKLTINREIYKFFHRKSTFVFPIFMLIFMIVMAFGMGKSSGRFLAMTTYNSGQWIIFNLAIVASTIFSNEQQNKTIFMVLYKSPNKITVYMSKLIVIIIYNIILHVLALLFSFGLTLTSINNKVNWLSEYKYHQILIVNTINTISIDMITTTLIISIIFLTSCLIKSNSIVVTLNIIIIFVGPYLTYPIMKHKNKMANVIKWNPMNMTNLTTQYYNYDSYHPITFLSNNQILIGAIMYTCLFFVIGWWIFRESNF